MQLSNCCFATATDKKNCQSDLEIHGIIIQIHFPQPTQIREHGLRIFRDWTHLLTENKMSNPTNPIRKRVVEKSVIELEADIYVLKSEIEECKEEIKLKSIIIKKLQAAKKKDKEYYNHDVKNNQVVLKSYEKTNKKLKEENDNLKEEIKLIKEQNEYIREKNSNLCEEKALVERTFREFRESQERSSLEREDRGKCIVWKIVYGEFDYSKTTCVHCGQPVPHTKQRKRVLNHVAVCPRILNSDKSKVYDSLINQNNLCPETKKILLKISASLATA